MTSEIGAEWVKSQNYLEKDLHFVKCCEVPFGEQADHMVKKAPRKNNLPRKIVMAELKMIFVCDSSANYNLD